MLNCVGNVIFNKNEKMYFARPDDTLPVLVYFNSVLDKAMTNYKTWCSIVLDNITRYEHLSHKDRMFIFKNKEIFKKYLEKNFSNYEKYLAMFYRQKQRYIVKIKRGDSK